MKMRDLKIGEVANRSGVMPARRGPSPSRRQMPAATACRPPRPPRATGSGGTTRPLKKRSNRKKASSSCYVTLLNPTLSPITVVGPIGSGSGLAMLTAAWRPWRPASGGGSGSVPGGGRMFWVGGSERKGTAGVSRRWFCGRSRRVDPVARRRRRGGGPRA